MSRQNIVLEKTAKKSVPLLDFPEATWLKECKEVSWNGKKPIGTGAYVTKVDDTEFHLCFCKSQSGSNRILVSLTGGAYGNNRDEGPRFNRWKYTDETNASVLCVDDPTVFMHHIKYGWFAGGTKECPMWLSLSRLILKVCSAAGLKDPDIVFFSSSSGGTASVLASSTIGVPCTVVVINPQINLVRATRYPGYMSRGYLCPLLKDPNYVFDIIRDHKENRYVLMENIASALDYDRYFSPLCSYLSIEPVYGITHRSNLVTWVYNAPTSIPHTAMDWRTFFPAIEFVIDNFDSIDTVPKHLLGMFTALIEEYHASQGRIAELEGSVKGPEQSEEESPSEDPAKAPAEAQPAKDEAKAVARKRRKKA